MIEGPVVATVVEQAAYRTSRSRPFTAPLMSAKEKQGDEDRKTVLQLVEGEVVSGCGCELV